MHKAKKDGQKPTAIRSINIQEINTSTSSVSRNRWPNGLPHQCVGPPLTTQLTSLSLAFD